MNTAYVWGLLGCLLNAVASGDTINLSGEWSVRLDPQDLGEREAWWDESFPDTCNLPGSLAKNGYGEPVGFDTPWDMSPRHIEQVNNSAKEFAHTGKFFVTPWLNPQLYYVGKAWYQKTIDLPLGKRKWRLYLERAQWSTTLWVNGKEIGDNDSLHTPHEYVFEASGPCRIALCIDNSRVHAIGMSSHSRSDQTQGTWNGIIGKMELEPVPSVKLQPRQWSPSYKNEQLEVLFSAKGLSRPEETSVELLLETHDTGQEVARRSANLASCLDQEGLARLELSVPEVRAWDEFSPQLYTTTLRLLAGGEVVAEQTECIGFRDVAVKGNRMLINGKPLFMRATLDCAIFPLTGYPTTDEALWSRILSQIKSYGCNTVRFHSWCPPEAAFIVADELGVYLQPEMCWAHVGRGDSIDQWLYDEGERILAAYGHHPSFLFFACGNEMDGPNGGRTREYPPFFDISGKQATFDRIMRRMPGAQYLSEWVTHFDGRTDLQLIAGSAGWPYIEEEHFHMHHEPLRLSGFITFGGRVAIGITAPSSTSITGHWSAMSQVNGEPSPRWRLLRSLPASFAKTY